MAQHVNVHISIEGEQISPFSGISITQDINQHHAFEVILPVDAFESTTRDVLQQSKGFIGKPIIIRFGPKLFEKDHPDNQFIGLVTNIGIRRSGHGERQVVIRGNSPTILMDGNGQCRSFTDKNLEDIANATLEKVPRSLETQLYPHYSGTIPYVVQYNESNWCFLQRMAARFGEWCYYNGTKLVFGKFQHENVIDLPFGEDLFGFDFALQLMPTNGKAVAYNYLESKVIQGTAAAVSVDDVDEFGKFALEQSAKLFSQEPLFAAADVVEQQKELDDILQQLKASAARDMVVASGDSDNPFINVGSTINITGEAINEQDYGRFIITSIIHSISGTYSYSNDFTAIPAESQSPPPASISKLQGDIQPALVVENKDPENLGRVKVRFYWQPAPESTPWVRVANTMAGNGQDAVHGFYFIPEIGDEVMVGFEDNNPDRPFVIGSMYHKNTAPTEWYDGDNNVKVIRTRSGNQIHLIDKGGKEEIKILNKDVDDPTNIISLSMDGKGKITIKTKGDLVMKARSIQMDATNDIKMTSGKATQIRAEEVSVKADQDVKIMSGKAIEMRAMEMEVSTDTTLNLKGQQMSLESAMVEVKASAKLDIDGGAMASVKAAIIKLN